MAHTVVPWTTSFGRPASHRVVRGIHPAGPLWHAVVDSSQSTMAKGALIHVHPRYEPASWLQHVPRTGGGRKYFRVVEMVWLHDSSVASKTILLPFQKEKCKPRFPKIK
jgi:hypothetical protein